MNLKGKKLLLQGAGRGHLGLIQTCKRLGVYTIVTGLKGNYPCINLADEFVECDIRDKNGVLDIARQKKIDGIIICCSDTGLECVGYVNDQLGLKGISEKAAELCSDKLKMKKRLVDANVRTAKYCSIKSKSDITAALDRLEFPLILKATDLQGSRGIYIVNSESQVLEAFDKVCELTRNPYCVLEEFIEGKEFGAQAFVSDGKVLFVLPHGDETIRCGTNVPIGHYIPFEMSGDILKDTELQVKGAIKALGLDNCAVNVDLIERDGKTYIIELTGRVGANCLPELTGNHFGIDYYEMIITEVLGGKAEHVFSQSQEPKATMAKMIKSNVNGIVDSIDINKTNDNQVTMFVNPGDEIRVFKNSNDAIGQVIAVGNNLDDCNNKIDETIEGISIILK